MFRSRHVTPGFTLLELLVVVVLLALAAAVVAPALRPPRAAAAIDEVTARARRVAVRRAETLDLRIRPDGGWTLVASDGDGTPADAAAPVLLAGRLDGPPSAERRLRFTPLGLCLPVDGHVGAPGWDPVRCGPVREGER